VKQILHILGGGNAQLNALRTAGLMGFKTAVSDMDSEAPCFREADFISQASSFDTEAVTRDAGKFGSSGFLVTGTDQPVLTAALAAENLNRPYFLTSRQARMVTNKRDMKKALKNNRIPTMPSVCLSCNFKDSETAHLIRPLVIKPLDSQGQRGIKKVHSCSEIRETMEETLSFSREDEFLVEEYYESSEITVSAWVQNHEVFILSVTDRITEERGSSIGVCLSHHYPSRFTNEMPAISEMTENISRMIGLKDGPLYFQFLIGDRGLVVNEIACRIGGAYEEIFIPWLTNIPLMELMINLSCQKKMPSLDRQKIDENRKGKIVSLQMLFCHAGKLHNQNGMETLSEYPDILGADFLLKQGTDIRKRENSTQRAGYFIASGNNRKDVNNLCRKCYNVLNMTDPEGRSLLHWNPEVLLPNET